MDARIQFLLKVKIDLYPKIQTQELLCTILMDLPIVVHIIVTCMRGVLQMETHQTS